MSMNFLPVYSQLIFEDGNPRQLFNIQQRSNFSTKSLVISAKYFAYYLF